MRKKSKAGGRRKGAGRPLNSGIYKEKTISIRIPVSLYPEISKILIKRIKKLRTVKVFYRPKVRTEATKKRAKSKTNKKR